jgi:hypothetical protein
MRRITVWCLVLCNKCTEPLSNPEAIITCDTSLYTGCYKITRRTVRNVFLMLENKNSKYQHRS